MKTLCLPRMSRITRGENDNGGKDEGKNENKGENENEKDYGIPF